MKRNLFIFCSIGTILLFVSNKLSDEIINEPVWLSVVVFLLSVAGIYSFVNNFFQSKETKQPQETATNKFFMVIIWLSIAAAVAFAALTPIRYAIILLAEKQTEEVKICEIKSFHKKNRNKKKYLYYNFNEHTNKKKLTMSEYKKLLGGRNSKNYKLYLTVRKSILNTYVIQNYEVKE